MFNVADGILTPCNVACGSGIMTVKPPSGSTLHCDTWLRNHDTERIRGVSRNALYKCTILTYLLTEFARWQHSAV